MAETEATNMDVQDEYRQLILREFKCPDCLDDPEVACARDKDIKCLHCGQELCAHHILDHLRTVHLVSVEWRGALELVTA